MSLEYVIPNFKKNFFHIMLHVTKNKKAAYIIFFF